MRWDAGRYDFSNLHCSPTCVRAVLSRRGPSNAPRAVSVGLFMASMLTPPEDTNYASFWPDAPMPTVLELLPPSAREEPPQDPDGVSDRAPQRRRRASSRSNQFVDDDQVRRSVAAPQGWGLFIACSMLSSIYTGSPVAFGRSQRQVFMLSGYFVYPLWLSTLCNMPAVLWYNITPHCRATPQSTARTRDTPGRKQLFLVEVGDNWQVR